MKSRITIEVDFENGNLPVIQILHRTSDDVRDNLIQSFLQSLQHTSRWCKIEYKGEDRTAEEFTNRWHVIPVVPKEIPKEMALMKIVFEKKK